MISPAARPLAAIRAVRVHSAAGVVAATIGRFGGMDTDAERVGANPRDRAR